MSTNPPTENNPHSRKGWLLGIGFGLVLIALFAWPNVGENFSYAYIPRFETFGFAVSLLPVSAWSGNQIAKRIGGPNKPFFFTALKCAMLINIVSVTGFIAGSAFGVHRLGLKMETELKYEVYTDLMLLAVGLVVFPLVTLLFSYPFQWWANRTTSTK